MMYWVLSLVTLLVLTESKHVLKWGATGHTTVADIGTVYLTETSAEKMNQILGGYSMGDVASWADQIRNDVDWTEPLHFIDVQQDPCNTTNGCEFVYERDCPEDMCVSGAIANYSAWLYLLDPKDLTSDACNSSTKFVIHFVGDIHQPLHVSKEADMGGNLISVTYQGSAWNLHSVWDSAMIYQCIDEDFNGSDEAFTQFLIDEIETTWKDEAKDWVQCNCDSGKTTVDLRVPKSASPESVLCCANQWAQEAFHDALNYAYLNEYGEEIKSGDVISNDYYLSRITVVQKRLAMGGVRLAALINALLAE